MDSTGLTTTLRETLAVFDGNGREPLTTQEVADELDIGRRSTYERLDRLVDQSHLDSKKVGARGRVWWQPESGSTEETAEEGEGAEGIDATEESDTAGSLHIEHVFEGIDVGVFVLDSNREVVWANDATETYFGIDRASAVGRDKRTLVEEELAPATDDPEAFEEKVLATDEAHTSTEHFQCRLESKDGGTDRWLEHRSQPIESGAYAGGSVEMYYEVTDRNPTEESRRTDNELFRSLVTATEEYAIFMLDPKGRVVTWNEGARRIKGYDREEILGEHFSRFYTEPDQAAGVPDENLLAAKEQGDVEDEGWRVRADGTQFWANVTITAIEENGTLQGYAKVTRDMTDRRRREQAIRRERNLLERVLETSPTGIAVFDENGDQQRVNHRFKELLWLDEQETDTYELGTVDIYDEDGNEMALEESPVVSVLETGEPVVDQRLRIEDGDRSRWLSVNAAPLDGESGDIVVTLADITQLKVQADRLERQRDELEHEIESVFERIDDAFFAVDDQFRIAYVNDRFEELIEREESEIFGEILWDEFPAASDTEFQYQYERAMENQESVQFEAYYPPLSSWFQLNAYPSESGLSVYFRDVTRRKQREEELKRYERIVETVDDGIYLLNDDNEFTMVNSAFTSMTRYDRTELLGSHAELVFGNKFDDIAAEEEAALESGDQSVAVIEEELYPAEGEPLVAQNKFTLYEFPDRTTGRIGVVRDVTERVERERELETRVRQQAVVSDLGQTALETADLDDLFDTVVNRVAETLDADCCEVLELRPEGDQFLLREGVGWQDGLVGSKTVTADRDTLPGFTLVSERPFVVDNLADETQFSPTEVLADHEMASGVSVSIGSIHDPWGVLGVYATDGEQFSDVDAQFVQAVANILATAIDRIQNERRLERQRERLDALNNLNGVVRRINEAVIEQSTRSEIEQAVVDALGESESYEFAWIAEADSATNEIAPRAQTDGSVSLDDLSLTVDIDSPVAVAFRSNELQTVDDIRADPPDAEWQRWATEHGFRSMVAIPITYEGSLYGVLVVLATREVAFVAEEREVVSHLGELVGHAIASVERKKALMSNEIVELEFEVPNLFSAFDVPSMSEGLIELEQTVPIGDGSFLVYWTIEGEGMELLEALVESDEVPHWQSLRTIGSDGDRKRVELRLSEPPVLSEIAAHGGYVDEVRIRNGTYSMTVHLAPSTDVRHITDSIKETYDDLEMIARRQKQRTESTTAVIERTLDQELTGRQRSILATAFHSGFFEWPRESSGEEVADSIGISAPTFHQHLRKAESKLFAAIFEEIDRPA